MARHGRLEVDETFSPPISPPQDPFSRKTSGFSSPRGIRAKGSEPGQPLAIEGILYKGKRGNLSGNLIWRKVWVYADQVRIAQWSKQECPSSHESPKYVFNLANCRFRPYTSLRKYCFEIEVEESSPSKMIGFGHSNTIIKKESTKYYFAAKDEKVLSEWMKVLGVDLDAARFTGPVVSGNAIVKNSTLKSISSAIIGGNRMMKSQKQKSSISRSEDHSISPSRRLNLVDEVDEVDDDDDGESFTGTTTGRSVNTRMTSNPHVHEEDEGQSDEEGNNMMDPAIAEAVVKSRRASMVAAGYSIEETMSAIGTGANTRKPSFSGAHQTAENILFDGESSPRVFHDQATRKKAEVELAEASARWAEEEEERILAEEEKNRRAQALRAFLSVIGADEKTIADAIFEQSEPIQLFAEGVTTEKLVILLSACDPIIPRHRIHQVVQYMAPTLDNDGALTPSALGDILATLGLTRVFQNRHPNVWPTSTANGGSPTYSDVVITPSVLDWCLSMPSNQTPSSDGTVSRSAMSSTVVGYLGGNVGLSGGSAEDATISLIDPVALRIHIPVTLPPGYEETVAPRHRFSALSFAELPRTDASVNDSPESLDNDDWFEKYAALADRIALLERAMTTPLRKQRLQTSFALSSATTPPPIPKSRAGVLATETVETLSSELTNTQWELVAFGAAFQHTALLGAKKIISELPLPLSQRTIHRVQSTTDFSGNASFESTSGNEADEYEFRGLRFRILASPFSVPSIVNQENIGESDSIVADFAALSALDAEKAKIATAEWRGEQFVTGAADELSTRLRMQEKYFAPPSSKEDRRNGPLVCNPILTSHIRPKLSMMVEYSGWRLLVSAAPPLTALSVPPRVTATCRDANERLFLARRGESFRAYDAGDPDAYGPAPTRLLESVTKLAPLADVVSAVAWRPRQLKNQLSTVSSLSQTLSGQLSTSRRNILDISLRSIIDKEPVLEGLSVTSQYLLPSALPRADTFDVLSRRIRPEAILLAARAQESVAAIARAASQDAARAAQIVGGPALSEVDDTELSLLPAYFLRAMNLDEVPMDISQDKHLSPGEGNSKPVMKANIPTTVSSLRRHWEDVLLAPGSIAGNAEVEALKRASLATWLAVSPELYGPRALHAVSLLDAGGLVSAADSASLSNFLHHHGVSLRQLGVCAALAITPTVRVSLLTEAVSRAVKSVVRNLLRTMSRQHSQRAAHALASNRVTPKDFESFVEDTSALRVTVILDVFNILFSNIPVSVDPIDSKTHQALSSLSDSKSAESTEALFARVLSAALYSKFGIQLRGDRQSLFGENQVHAPSLFAALQTGLSVRFKDTVYSDLLSALASSSQRIDAAGSVKGSDSLPRQSNRSSSGQTLEFPSCRWITTADLLEASLPTVKLTPNRSVVTPGLAWHNDKGPRTFDATQTSSPGFGRTLPLHASSRLVSPFASGELAWLLTHIGAFTSLGLSQDAAALLRFSWHAERQSILSLGADHLLGWSVIAEHAETTFQYVAAEMSLGTSTSLDRALLALSIYLTCPFTPSFSVSTLRLLCLAAVLHSEKRNWVAAEKCLDTALSMSAILLPSDHPLAAVPCLVFSDLALRQGSDLLAAGMRNKTQQHTANEKDSLTMKLGFLSASTSAPIPRRQSAILVNPNFQLDTTSSGEQTDANVVSRIAYSLWHKATLTLRCAISVWSSAGLSGGYTQALLLQRLAHLHADLQQHTESVHALQSSAAWLTDLHQWCEGLNGPTAGLLAARVEEEIESVHYLLTMALFAQINATAVENSGKDQVNENWSALVTSAMTHGCAFLESYGRRVGDNSEESAHALRYVSALLTLHELANANDDGERSYEFLDRAWRTLRHLARSLVLSKSAPPSAIAAQKELSTETVHNVGASINAQVAYGAAIRESLFRGAKAFTLTALPRILAELSVQGVSLLFRNLPWHARALLQSVSEEWNLLYAQRRRFSLLPVNEEVDGTVASDNKHVTFASDREATLKEVTMMTNAWESACSHLIDVLWRGDLPAFVASLVAEIQDGTKLFATSSGIPSNIPHGGANGRSSMTELLRVAQFSFDWPLAPLPLEVQASALFLILQEPLGFVDRVMK